MADVPVNRVSGLVVPVRRNPLTSWLNGTLISSVGVDASPAGAVTFFATSQGTAPAAVTLSDIFIFAAAG